MAPVHAADPQHSLVVNFDSFDYTRNLNAQKPYLRKLARSFPVVVLRQLLRAPERVRQGVRKHFRAVAK